MKPEFEFEDDIDDSEAFLARRLSKGKDKFKGKLPLIYYKHNEVVNFAAKCHNRSKSDINDKKYHKYKKNKDYKDKGKKSCYIVEEEHTESSSDDEKEAIEMVYVSIKEDPDRKRY